MLPWAIRSLASSNASRVYVAGNSGGCHKRAASPSSRSSVAPILTRGIRTFICSSRAFTYQNRFFLQPGTRSLATRWSSISSGFVIPTGLLTMRRSTPGRVFTMMSNVIRKCWMKHSKLSRVVVSIRALALGGCLLTSTTCIPTNGGQSGLFDLFLSEVVPVILPLL